MTNVASHRFIAFVLGLAAGLPGLTACSGAVPLDNRACPCASGWTCCPNNTCSRTGTCSTDGGIDVGTPMRPNPNDPGYPPDPAFDVPAGLAGTWTGYFENYKFPSSSDSFKLVISQPAEQSGSIAVILGAEPPPPPPTDATMSWPLGAGGDPDAGADNAFSVIEGFAYTAHEVVWSGQRLTFRIAPEEAMTVWCSLQTPYFVHSEGYYWCVPGVSGSQGNGMCYAQDSPDPNNPDNVVHTLVPCAQYHQCGACACDATSCTGGKRRSGSFDITFASGSASGSGATPGNFVRPIKLMPAP